MEDSLGFQCCAVTVPSGTCQRNSPGAFPLLRGKSVNPERILFPSVFAAERCGCDPHISTSSLCNPSNGMYWTVPMIFRPIKRHFQTHFEPET